VDIINFFPKPWKGLRNRNTTAYTVNDIGASPPTQSLVVFLQSRSVCRQYHAETKLLIFEINTLRMYSENISELIQQMPKGAQDVISVIQFFRVIYWRNWDLEKDFGCSAPFPNLRKFEVQPDVYDGTEEDLLLKTEEWCRPYIGGAEIKVLSKDVSHPI
jgi:hypothetical protein